MFEILKWSLYREYKYYYNSWHVLPLQFINEAVILIVLWFTAKAFVPSVHVFRNNTVDYFTFVVIGETVLRIPTFFISSLIRNLRLSVYEGYFEHLLLLPVKRSTAFLLPAFAGALLEIIKIFIILVCIKVFWEMNISSLGLILSMLMQIIAIGTFIGLGLISCSILMYWGRGEAIVLKGMSLATILAGVYFPVILFPDWFQSWINQLSPFNLLLNASRSFLSGNFQNAISPFAIMSFWSMVLSLCGVLIFKIVLFKYKKNDRKIVILT